MKSRVLTASWLAATWLVVPAPTGAADDASGADSQASSTATAAPTTTAAPGEPDATAGGDCAAGTVGEMPQSFAALVAERRAKCSKLKPYRQGWFERQLIQIERADRPPPSRLNLVGFYPRLQSIDHRSQLTLGARYWHPATFGTKIDLHGAFFQSLAGFQYGEAQVGVMPHRSGSLPPFVFKGDDVFEIVNVRPDDQHPITLYGSWYYRWSPRYDYYGVGPDAAVEDHSDFRQKDKLVDVVAGVRVVRRLSVVGRAGRWRVSTGRGEDDSLPNVDETFPPAQIPGYGETIDYFRYGASLIFDARDVRGNPHSGVLLAAQVLQFDQMDGSGYSFRRLSAEVHGYLPLGHRQRVLALRAYLTRDDPEQGGQVPFFALAAIGSGGSLRGFQSQRFRGERIALLQAEYRIELAPTVELALFGDAGAVSARFDERVSGWRSDGGFGLRFKNHESVVLRTDFAWGNEGFRFLFRFGRSF